jgi:hypothetical protein
MLLLRGAHATTFGFMAAVGRLKFGQRVTPKKHECLLTLLAAFFRLGYPWLFILWLTVLTVQSLRGRVAVGHGFLVMLSKRTCNPEPSARQVAVGGLVAGSLAIATTFTLAVSVDNHPGVVWSAILATSGSAFGSVLIRHRRDYISRPPADALLVQNLVPTNRRFRHIARTVAPQWIARQQEPLYWVADEGLKAFYEDILTPWGVKGRRVNKGRTGFWGLLWPARYSFLKP